LDTGAGFGAVDFKRSVQWDFLEAGSSTLYLTPLPQITKLTPRSRVGHDKLIVFQLIKQFSAFYGKQRFITVFI
jgi:hypothetical protein